MTLEQLQDISTCAIDGDRPLLRIDPEAANTVQIECKYHDYLKRQSEDMEKYRLAVSTHLELPTK